MNNSLIYIFDVDGTLTSHRYDNDEVLSVKPNRPILGIALAVSATPALGRVAVVTARPHYLLEDTRLWLTNLGLHPEVLFTREEEDFRPDHEVRVDQVGKVMEVLGKNVVLLDDKLTNCLAVRAELGVPCIHIREQ